jgi:hypothetical protein
VLGTARPIAFGLIARRRRISAGWTWPPIAYPRRCRRVASAKASGMPVRFRSAAVASPVVTSTANPARDRCFTQSVQHSQLAFL